MRHPLAGGFALALLGLVGCPQLLDDDFTTLPAFAVNPDAAAPPTNAGAGGSAATAGTGGAGAVAGSGGSGAAQSGGASGNVDPPDAGSVLGGSGNVDATAPPPDAAPPEPQTPLGSLIDHRYSFAETGSLVADSVGGANGTAVGAAVAANSGKITLSGTDQYVDLPNRLISDFASVTFEAWVNWTANPALAASNWQTLFSFGSNVAGENQQGEATTYVYFTPKSGNSNEVRGGFTLTGFANEIFADGDVVFPASGNTQVGTHMAFVVDSAAGRVSMYVQGELVPADPPGLGAIDLSEIDDVNNWIGRSQFAADPEFQGDILEFRIYGSALSAAEIELSFSLGPDAVL